MPSDPTDVGYLERALKAATAEELAELYVVGDWDVYGAALHAFQRRTADALAQGLRLAESDDPVRREKACWLIAVGGKRSDAAEGALAALVADGDARVVGAAVQGYSILQLGRSLPENGKRVTADPATATFPWPEPLPAFIDLPVLATVARHEDAGVRMHVAMALWMCGEDEATRMLVELAADGDEVVRSAALSSMGWKRFAGGVTDEVLDALWSAAAQDASPHVRVTAVTSLVKLEQPGARERFIEELQAAIDRNASHLEIYPMTNLLYDELSEFLPSDLREEACRRWAKNIAGKGVPRRSKEGREEGP